MRRSPLLRTQYSVLSTEYWRGPALALVLLGSSAHSGQSESYADRLAALAVKYDELGLKEQAEITRGWPISRHSGRQYLFLPSAADPAAPKAGATAVVKQWYDQFIALRRERAAELLADAKSAPDQRLPTRAYQLLYEVLREDPNHAEARRVLGFVKTSRGEWRLPDWEKAAIEPGRIDHPKLGWRAGRYWRLETPHFQIITDHKQELLKAGQQLENLHDLWRQIFYRYWSNQEALDARMAGGNEPLAPARPKMQVVIFKDRPSYAAYVATAHPKAASTVGFYDDKQQIAYFYYSADASVYPTWYHEATHQLFQESVVNTRSEPGQQRNFWALEGAALYVESLAEHAGHWTVGGCEADRLQYARYKVLSGNLVLPLERITGLSRDDLQHSNDIGRIYTQAAGLAHFLMDGEDGKYREAFIDLLAAIYRGEDAADSLARATGQSLAALDEQYRKFLLITDEDLQSIPDASGLRNLSLFRGQVTHVGLSRFVGTKQLLWLDLSFSGATDEDLKLFAGNSKLKQLFLEGTKVTGDSLPLIAGFKELESLDLSRLEITDESLTKLALLKNLKTLFLIGCPITDAGLVHLRGLKQLEELDTSDTQITPEARKRLKAALPKLK